METLEGEILAIDASIWLTQFLKAMRDPQTGQSQPAAHLIGFVRRLCRLYFHGIRPVLVFDGATPEIKLRELHNRRKRREQFASSASDAGVQRLARRILAQNLKNLKAAPKTAVPASGSAPNFYLGSQASAGASTGAAAAATPSDLPTASSMKGPSVATPEDEAAILAAIREDMDEEEAKKKGKKPANDWDEVVVVDEAVGDKAAENQDEDEVVEYEDFGGRQSRISFGNKPIQVSEIASLPATERKEAIEAAKRHQRMQSRREFMPAAANPDKFSSVQMQNFLKSSRFNLDIKEMATAEAKLNNEHGGDLMASDRSTRMSLIREDEEKEESDDVEEYDDLFKKRPAKRQKLIELKDDSSDDDEIEWQEGEAEKTSAGPVARRRKVIFEEDSDEDDPPPIKQSTGFLNPLGETKKAPHSDGFEGDNFEGGGFLSASAKESSLPVLGETHGNEQVGDGLRPPLKSSERKDIVHLEEDESSSDSFGGGRGGFLTSRDDAVAKKKEVIEIDDSSNGDDVQENTLQSRSAKQKRVKDDAKIAQEMSDAMLARALEEGQVEANLNDRGGAAATNGESSDDSVQWVDGEEGVAETRPDAAKHSIGAESRSSDASDDGVEWEGGDDEIKDDGEKQHGKIGDVGTMRQSEIHSEKESSVALNQAATRSRMTTIPPSILGAETMSYPASHTHLPDESDDDVIWEDGNDEVNRKMKEWGGDGDEDTRDSTLVAPSSTSRATNTEQGVAPSNRSDETTAALARAEAAALNLASWAGRAFRRAMRETGELPVGTDRETKGELKAPPHATRGEERQSDSDEDEEVRVVRGPVPTRPTLSQSDRREASAPTRSSRAAHGERESVPVSEETKAATAAMLQEYEDEWTKERNQRERDADTMTDEMKEEVMTLLRLFGVPYVVSPAEAEAQCAALEQMGLVDGIVTEDSDVFVFGGKKIYKNIFDERLYAEAYIADDAEREMSLGRNAMVALAMLLGSDYTDGVKGVGIVNSMEVLRAFDVSQDLKGGLRSFRTWLDGVDLGNFRSKVTLANEDAGPRKAFHAKHKSARSRWIPPEHFPAENVIRYVIGSFDSEGESTLVSHTRDVSPQYSVLTSIQSLISQRNDSAGGRLTSRGW